MSKSRSFEYLRLTSLGVIGALVKGEDTQVTTFLLNSEVIPLLLRLMESGSELSKVLATFTIQRLLLDPVGLNYVCQTFERYYAVSSVFATMTESLVDQPSLRLLKHVVRCYLALSSNQRAREALSQANGLPEAFKRGSFNAVLKDDPTTRQWLDQVLLNCGIQGR